MNHKRIKQIYRNCLEWEDLKNGMYQNSKSKKHDVFLAKSKSLLSNAKRLKIAMRMVVVEWPICSEVHLTNVSENRRAWMGWAACNFVHGSPEFITREAWALLSDDQREKANKVAEIVISEWEQEYEKLH